MKKQKRCCVCGRKVDLRKRGSAEFSDNVKEKTGVKNPEYQYWCSEECQKEWGVHPAGM